GEGSSVHRHRCAAWDLAQGRRVPPLHDPGRAGPGQPGRLLPLCRALRGAAGSGAWRTGADREGAGTMTIRVWLFGFLTASPLSAQATPAIQGRAGGTRGPVAHARDPALREPAALQRCGFRTPAVGCHAGSGVVTNVIRPSGRADTATVKVVAADSVT